MLASEKSRAAGVSPSLDVEQKNNENNEADLVANWQAPRVQQRPSREYPFLFYHLRKTGGTSIRNMITESAQRLGLGLFAPGIRPIDYNHYSLDALKPADRSSVEVAVGHFKWGLEQTYLQQKNNSYNLPSEPRDEMACLTVLR